MATADANYVHHQTLPAAEWQVTHNLAKFPSVEIIDSNGEEVDGEIRYLDINVLVLTFVGAFSGYAILN